MTISVLTPERTIFSGSITRVTLPGVEGSFQLLDNHAPLVSALTGGKVSVLAAGTDYNYYDSDKKAVVPGADSGRSMTFTIEGGFVEVLNNKVNLLVQGARNLR